MQRLLSSPVASTHTPAMLTLHPGPSLPGLRVGSLPAARGPFPKVRWSPQGSSGPWRAGGTAGGTRPPAGRAFPSPSVREAFTPQHPPQCFHVIRSDQVRSVTQSCLTLCDPMNHSTPGLPVHHQLPEVTQTHVHRVSDAIQLSHPLSSPSPPAPNPSQHQSFPMSQLFA